MIVSVAPNGGRLQKSDHPALPLALDELVAEARACRDAGARLMHFHVRDREGRHRLDAGLYREALTTLEAEVQGMLYQISSEALGRYSSEEQMSCLFESGCRLASVAFREMTADGMATARRFYLEARERGVHLQHILYAPSEAVALKRAWTQGVFGKKKLCLLFVYGSYDESLSAMPSFDTFLQHCLNPFQEKEWEGEVVWFLCTFGKQEQSCLLQAMGEGGHARVGFENNTMLSCGSLAVSNAEQVRLLVAAMRAQGLEAASFAETCTLLEVSA